MAANLGDLTVMSARNFLPGLADNITRHCAFLRWAKKNGMIKSTEGGRVIDESLLYGTNSSLQWYSDFDNFTPPTTQEVVDAAEYSWKQLGVFITVSGKEKRMNMGENKRKDVVKTRLKQAQALLMNAVNAALFATGTGFAGKEIGGLRHIVQDDPTAAGTVGGINQVTNPFWRNYFSAAAATSASNIRSRMNSAWLSTIRGTDKPGLILGDDDMYNYYLESLQALAQFVDAKEADAGFGTLRYKNALVEFDPDCPDKHMYFLQPDNITLRVIDDRSVGFEVGDKRVIANADYEAVPIFFMGNMTSGWRAGHGVIIAS